MSTHDIEEGAVLSPKFDVDGLVTAVVVDAGTGAVLMVAHMDAEALQLTIETRQAHFFSRSRKRLWKKGEESGHVQSVVEMRVDCDQDAVLLKVQVGGTGASCHTGRVSCFYRQVALGTGAAPDLSFVDDEKQFEPADVYRRS